jgi:hypothetical protein
VPTARELLEQADALMRRNRALAPEVRPIAVEIPLLTEAVNDVAPEPQPAPDVMPDGTQRAQARASPVALDDVPVLTDAVEEIDAPPLVDEPDQGEVSRWLEIDRGETSITGPLPDSVVVVPPPELQSTAEPAVEHELAEEQPIELAAPPEIVLHDPSDDLGPLTLDEIEAPVAPSDSPPEAPSEAAALASARIDEPAAVATTADEDLRWNALAEEIRMQVLQRIDIFTDTGLREQLNARLQPIVDRASADLVATINQHVGQLIRSYVAEAIEREIEKWRQGGG